MKRASVEKWMQSCQAYNNSAMQQMKMAENLQNIKSKSLVAYACESNVTETKWRTTNSSLH